MNEQTVNNFETGKKWAVGFGAVVYIGVVLLFSVFYQGLMGEQFKDSGTILQLIAKVGAWMVGSNAIALPLALHFWAVTGKHRGVAIGFYALDIIIMGMNVLAASQHASGQNVEWVTAYASYAPATIVFVLFGWALLWMTDPGQRALVKLQESISNAQVKIVNRAVEHINSDEGAEAIITPFAAKLASKIFNEGKLIGTKKSLPVSQDTETVNSLVEKLLEQMGKQETPQLVAPKTEETEDGQPVPFRSNGLER